MRRVVLVSTALAFAVVLAPLPAAALKKVPYEEVKLQAPPPVQADAALQTLRKSFADAVAKKNLAALSALVAPNFAWTSGGQSNEQYDKTKDGLHNFKVAFGFRPPGKDADGKTDAGPQWETLAELAANPELARGSDAETVCGPIVPIPDQAAFEKAIQTIEEQDQPAEWIFSLNEITLSANPTGGAAVGKAARSALPVVSTYPAAGQGQKQGPAPTHVELLLPSGKTGWVAANAVRPMFGDQLCYAKQANGSWRISGYDQGE